VFFSFSQTRLAVLILPTTRQWTRSDFHFDKIRGLNIGFNQPFFIMMYIIHRPFNCMDNFTPYIFLAYFVDMFFSLFSIIWGHSVTTSCSSLSEFQWPKFEIGLWLLFPQDNRTFGISGINLCHLGAELSISRCRKLFRGLLPIWKKNKKM
jgi:hypothetical protein